MLCTTEPKTSASVRIIAIIVTLLMVINLQPVLAQKTPVSVDIHNFSNGNPIAELKLDGMHSNSSVGFSIYKKTQIDSAALSIKAAGMKVTRAHNDNNTTDFQQYSGKRINTVAESGSVHLTRENRSLDLRSGTDFFGGDSNGLVADMLGVHMATGSGQWDQWNFTGGPGASIDTKGTAFDNGQQVDWSNDDGGLRLAYFYKYASGNGGTGTVPTVRGGMAYATDPSGKVIYIMGGWNRTSGRVMDSYSLSLGANVWRKQCGPCKTNYMMPDYLDPLANASMVWNQVRGTPIISGGDNASFQATTPSYELLQYMSAMYYYSPMPQSSLPSPRSGQSEVYDPQDFQAILFGGRDNNGAVTNTVYTVGNTTIWNDISTNVNWRPNPAPPRYGHSAVWDPIGKRMYIFGGVTGTGQYLNDVWVFTPADSNFIKLDKISQYAPAARAFQGAVWDNQVGAMVIFGGRDQFSIFDDIWAYFPNNNTWVQEPIKISPSDVRWSMASSWDPIAGIATIWGGLQTMNGDPASPSLLTLNGQYWGTGQIDSSVIDAGTMAQWKSVNIRTSGIFGANPVGSLKFYMRTGNTPSAGDASWSGWRQYDINMSLDSQAVIPSEYMQYRLVLSSFNSHQSPVVYNLTIAYDTATVFGWLTTGQFDLRDTPLVFQNLSSLVYEAPFSRTDVSIDIRDNVTDPWKEFLYTDNATLRTIKPARYIRFNISMSTGIVGISSYLVSLELNYTVIQKSGLFQIKVPYDGAEIQWVQASWAPGELRPGMGRGSVTVQMSNNNGWVQLTNGQTMTMPHGNNVGIPSYFINVTFETDGLSDPILKYFHMTFGCLYTPSDVTVDIGNDSTPDFTWAGPHDQGENADIPKFNEIVSKFITNAPADTSGHVFVPIVVSSKAPCMVDLTGLQVKGVLADVPPNITSDPPLKAEVGIDYRYEVTVSNKDMSGLNYTITKGPDGMLFSGHVLLWTPTKYQVGFQDVVISVSDGYDATSQSFRILVDGSNPGHPPEFQSWPDGYIQADGTVPLKYGDTFHYQIKVKDPDSGDTVTVYLEQGPKAMSLNQNLMIMDWTPTDKDISSFKVVLRASDGKGSAYQTFRIVVVANKAPQFDAPVPNLSVKAGKSLKYQVKASDKDGDTVKYSLKNNPAWMTIDNQGQIMGSPGTNSVGKTTFTVIISDGHLNATQAVTVEVLKDTTIGGMAQDDLMGILIILLIVCIIIIVVAFVVVRSRKKKATTEKAFLEATRAPTAPAPVQPVEPAPRPVKPPTYVPPTAPIAQVRPVEAPVAEFAKEEKPTIEDIYLIYNDGRLIAHESAKGTVSMDEHVLSGMLKAIQEFVKDSFQKEGALGGLDYGDSRIMLESGNCATFAIVLKGKETKALREETRRALEKIEGLYAGVIECWDGDTGRFGDVKKYFGSIFSLGKTQEEQAEAGDVKILSGLEFYQGYVRLKAAVKNNYPFMVYDVSLKIIYDKKALQLDHIEPEYELEGSDLVLGNIPPNEKKTVAFYLDPIICQESSIDATAIFKNYKGELKTVIMKRRPVDIVCPIFYTEQNVNVAMLKRLISELKYKDSKIFAVPKTLLPTEAMRIAKAVVESRDVKFVREFVEENPYIGEAWFYGKTKHSLEDLTIRVTMREDRGLLEFFVASNNLATLPGLLADLGHGLKKRYAEGKRTKEGLTQVTDVKIKDEMEKSRLLIDKYVSTEAPASTDETDL